MKRLIAVVLVLSLYGCTPAQLRQELVGLSVADVKTFKTRQTQQYALSSEECMAKIKEMLDQMKAIVREDEKNNFLLVDNLQGAFRSSINTTQVGILVTAWEPKKTQVDVASGNTDLAIFVSKKISEKLRPAPPKKAAVAEETETIE